MIPYVVYNDQEWIGVDLDGTLAKYHGWKGIEHIGEPIPKMLDRVKGWIEDGERVKIFTARVVNGSRAIMFIRSWIVKVGLPPNLEITNVKDFLMRDLWDDRVHRVKINTGELDWPK